MITTLIPFFRRRRMSGSVACEQTPFFWSTVRGSRSVGAMDRPRQADFHSPTRGSSLAPVTSLKGEPGSVTPRT